MVMKKGTLPPTDVGIAFGVYFCHKPLVKFSSKCVRNIRSKVVRIVHLELYTTAEALPSVSFTECNNSKPNNKK